MFVSTNKLADLLPYFERKLEGVYDSREIENIFYWVAEALFGVKRSEMRIADYQLTESELLRIKSIVDRLQNHEPIQQIIGEVEFFGCPIYVNPDVLIPRPETEELVDLVLQSNLKPKRIVDVGTGSGCIPIALKKNLPDAEIIAIDISNPALELAKKSALRNKTDIVFHTADIMREIPGGLEQSDIIISNPPYITTSERAKMDPNVLNFEPENALFVPDDDPIKFYKRIAEIAMYLLVDGGELYYELNPLYAQAVQDYLFDLGFESVVIFQDLQGRDRMLKATKVS